MHLIALLLFSATISSDAAELTIDTAMPPPAWALLERELLVANARACEEPLSAGKSLAIHDASFGVVLAPGAGARLTVSMQRYANQPTLSPPSR